MKAYRGSRGIAPVILNLDDVVVNLTPRSFYLRAKEPPVPIERAAGWAPGPFWTFWRRETLWFLPGFKHRIVQPVACSLY
jgi:hypothetical protein